MIVKYNELNEFDRIRIIDILSQKEAMKDAIDDFKLERSQLIKNLDDKENEMNDELKSLNKQIRLIRKVVDIK